MVPMRARDDTMTTTEANVLVQYSQWDGHMNSIRVEGRTNKYKDDDDDDDRRR